MVGQKKSPAPAVAAGDEAKAKQTKINPETKHPGRAGQAPRAFIRPYGATDFAVFIADKGRISQVADFSDRVTAADEAAGLNQIFLGT